MANTTPEARQRRGYVLDAWKRLRGDYPQLANRAYINFLSDKAIKKKYGQGYSALAFGDPNTGQIAFNTDYLNAVPQRDLDYVLTKELGQANAGHLVGTERRGDALMNAWGYQGDRSQRGSDGLAGPGPTWFTNTADNPNALSIGQFRSYPQDLYGVEFAAALGRLPMRQDTPTEGLLNPLQRLALQKQGILPKRNPTAETLNPVAPQPNTSDFGRRVGGARAGAQHSPIEMIRTIVEQKKTSQRDQAQRIMRMGIRGAF